MSSREEVEKRVLEEFDVLFGYRPEQAAGVKIEHREEDYVISFMENVFDEYGIDLAEVDDAPRELGAFIDFVAKRAGEA